MVCIAHLTLDFTSFASTNGVPDYVGNLTNLQVFSAASTLFTGPLRGSVFASLTQLIQIFLKNNAFHSTIPTVFGSLTKLTTFSAPGASLSGDLSFTNGMKSLNFLELTGNSITGTLPAFLGNLSALGYVYLSNNLLVGSLPTELGLLSQLLIFRVASNRLTGTIPSEIGALTTFLTTFHVENNTLATSDVNYLCRPNFSLGVDCTTVNCTCSSCCCSVSACVD